MKIVHVMCGEKFTVSVARFYDRYFNGGEHSILYINQKGKNSLILEELSIEQKEVFMSEYGISSARKLFRTLKEYDYVVVHSFFLNDYYKLLWGMQKKLCKKTVWIEWGFDLYSCFTEKATLIGKIKDSINRKLRNRIGSVVGIFPPDCDYFREIFPAAQAKVYYAPYCGDKIAEEYRRYMPESRLGVDKASGEPIYIQIGHNAVSTLCHIAVLEKLSKYKNENIRLLIPLSYPKNEYADAVQKRAEELFGDKAICLREMMPKEEYFALTSRVAIGIFNTDRQCGLGNIKRMIFKNVKLYMPQESVMYQYFIKNGVPIQNYERLDGESFEQFISEIQLEEKEIFKKFIDGFSDMEKNIGYWKAVYDDLRLRLTENG